MCPLKTITSPALPTLPDELPTSEESGEGEHRCFRSRCRSHYCIGIDSSSFCAGFAIRVMALRDGDRPRHRGLGHFQRDSRFRKARHRPQRDQEIDFDLAEKALLRHIHDYQSWMAKQPKPMGLDDCSIIQYVVLERLQEAS